jgi:hypothetical protein
LGRTLKAAAENAASRTRRDKIADENAKAGNAKVLVLDTTLPPHVREERECPQYKVNPVTQRTTLGFDHPRVKVAEGVVMQKNLLDQFHPFWARCFRLKFVMS